MKEYNKFILLFVTTNAIRNIMISTIAIEEGSNYIVVTTALPSAVVYPIGCISRNRNIMNFYW
jgi:hypothetical protein